MSDKNKAESTAAKAGAWLARLLGRRNLEKLSDSARALKEEYDAGREEAKDPPVRSIPHEVVDSESEEAS